MKRIREPTQKNASRFTDETLEHYADIIANKKNYIGYLANRPGAVKFGSHGLFSQTDEPINLNMLLIVQELTDKGVGLISLKEQVDTDTPQGRFMLTVFAALAELERERFFKKR